MALFNRTAEARRDEERRTIGEETVPSVICRRRTQSRTVGGTYAFSWLPLSSRCRASTSCTTFGCRQTHVSVKGHLRSNPTSGYSTYVVFNSLYSWKNE